ncbi:hypothetical protein FRC10_007092 [Ceratobasidium sp. 414]|nr:hypothetical protein FRC10_007092 [Ceratobasidium sp. 414]
MVSSTPLDASQVAAGDLVAAMPPLGLTDNSVAVDRVVPNPIDHLDSIEDKSPPLDDGVKDIDISFDEKDPHSYANDSSEDVKMVNGQPVIETVSETSLSMLNVR